MKTLKALAILLALASAPLSADVLLEGKGAYFLATNNDFKDLYQDGGGVYGVELTFQLSESVTPWNAASRWYGFVSGDYFKGSGNVAGMDSSTRIEVVPIAAGLKYFLPTLYENIDVYAGLGIEPVYMYAKNRSPVGNIKEHNWAFGGIAKIGSYVYLRNNFLLDAFVDYSYVSVSAARKVIRKEGPSGPLVPLNTTMSGFTFGGGVGHRF